MRIHERKMRFGSEGCGEDVEEFKRGPGGWFNALLEEKGLPPLTGDSVLVVWEFELAETA
jgi:hypothetical protein